MPDVSADMWWVVAKVVMAIIGALLSGFAGGWAVAWRMGAWRQKVEDRLDTHKKRLEKGEDRVDKVPILNEQINQLINVVGELRSTVQSLRDRFVTQRECDQRHEGIPDASDEGSG